MTRGLTFEQKGTRIAILLLFIFICLLGKPSTLYGQSSLKAALKHLLDQTDSLALLDKFPEAIKKLEAYADTIKQVDDPQLKAAYYGRLAYVNSMNGQDQASISFFHQAIHFAIIAKDSIELSDALNNLGVAIGYTGHPDSAIYFLEKSLKIREAMGDSTRLAATYRNMAEVLRVLKRMDGAVTYCRKAYMMIPGINNFKVTANIYNETAYLHELADRLDSAAYFYQKLIDISKEKKFTRGLAVGFSNLASVYQCEKKFDKALELMNFGLQLDRNIGNDYGIMTSYRVIASCFNEMGNYTTALLYLDSATILCDTSWVSDLQGLEQSKYIAWKGLGNYKLALAHFEKSTMLKDSILNEKKRKNIAEILTKYETEKKEQHIELLNKTNELHERRNRIQLLILIASLLISISGASISWLIIKNKNHRIRQMDLELRNFLLQIHETEKNQGYIDSALIRLKSEFGLTQREIEILGKISEGNTNAELAEKLFISENTIKYHIKNIYIKLDVKNRVQALRKTHLEEV